MIHSDGFQYRQLCSMIVEIEHGLSFTEFVFGPQTFLVVYCHSKGSVPCCWFHEQVMTLGILKDELNLLDLTRVSRLDRKRDQTSFG